MIVAADQVTVTVSIYIWVMADELWSADRPYVQGLSISIVILVLHHYILSTCYIYENSDCGQS